MQDHLLEIIDHLPSLIISVDDCGQIVYVNRAAKSLFEMQDRRAIGLKLAEVGLTDVWSRISSHVFDDDSRAGLMLDDIPLSRISGETLYLGLTVFKLRKELEGRISMVLFGADITERRKFEALSLQRLKLESIGQLASGIAHEINTPLQFLGDNLEFLGEVIRRLFKEDGNGVLGKLISGTASAKLIADLDMNYLNLEVPQAISQSKEGVARISQIVRAMKAYSHPDVDVPPIVDFNECVRDAIIIAHGQCKHAANVVIDLDATVGAVQCHPGGVGQIVLNLIINAAHAIEDSNRDSTRIGTITVTTRRDDRFVSITVSDTGTGIPDHIKGRVFDPFFTTKPVGVGTGQGLFITRRIVERGHGGTIDFETENGKGTRFIVRIPLQRTPMLTSYSKLDQAEMRLSVAEPKVTNPAPSP